MEKIMKNLYIALISLLINNFYLCFESANYSDIKNQEYILQKRTSEKREYDSDSYSSEEKSCIGAVVMDKKYNYKRSRKYSDDFSQAIEDLNSFEDIKKIVKILNTDPYNTGNKFCDQLVEIVSGIRTRLQNEHNLNSLYNDIQCLQFAQEVKKIEGVDEVYFKKNSLMINSKEIQIFDNYLIILSNCDDTNNCVVCYYKGIGKFFYIIPKNGEIFDDNDVIKLQNLSEDMLKNCKKQEIDNFIFLDLSLFFDGK